jgi:TolA-binding protein
MKATERHRLKQNDLGVVARQTREALEQWKSQLAWLSVIVVLAAVVVLGYWGWRGRIEGRAQASLADALTVQDTRIGPPAAATGQSGPTFPTEAERAQAAVAKFTATADAFPSTDAGLFARYQEASTWMTLGNPTAAAKAYQQVIDSAGNRLLGQMARLGLAETHARSGQFDQAIATFRQLADRKDGELPVDGILMQLGRAYLEAGRPKDARQTFSRLVEEFPDSPFTADARRQLDELKAA